MLCWGTANHQAWFHLWQLESGLAFDIPHTPHRCCIFPGLCKFPDQRAQRESFHQTHSSIFLLGSSSLYRHAPEFLNPRISSCFLNPCFLVFQHAGTRSMRVRFPKLHNSSNLAETSLLYRSFPVFCSHLRFDPGHDAVRGALRLHFFLGDDPDERGPAVQISCKRVRNWYILDYDSCWLILIIDGMAIWFFSDHLGGLVGIWVVSVINWRPVSPEHADSDGGSQVDGEGDLQVLPASNEVVRPDSVKGVGPGLRIGITAWWLGYFPGSQRTSLTWIEVGGWQRRWRRSWSTFRSSTCWGVLRMPFWEPSRFRSCSICSISGPTSFTPTSSSLLFLACGLALGELLIRIPLMQYY